MCYLWQSKNSIHQRWCCWWSFLNSTIYKLPFELHLLGHNLTGPGTGFNKRLNTNGTPKQWSIQINRVHNAAYHHDLCYFKHHDAKTRNEVCDKTMLNELNRIINPTLRERIDKAMENSSELKLISGRVILLNKKF